MPSDLVTIVGIGCCLGLIGYAAMQFRQTPKGKKGERRRLGEIAWLWTGRKQTVVDFRDLARIWRITPEVKNEPQPAPEYTHPEIREFHAKWLSLPTVKGEKKLVIENILSILDQKGDCPSVVQKNPNEAEKKYDKDVFALLAQVPLWQHSLAVAANLAGSMKQAVMIPDALIAGLGHDLGKIPSYQAALYRTGDHPVLSIIALNRVPGFESMSNMDDITQAVRQHHQVAPDNPLGEALKRADQKARLDEISRPSPAGRDIRLEPEEEKPESIGAEKVPPSGISKEKTEEKEGTNQEGGQNSLEEPPMSDADRDGKTVEALPPEPDQEKAAQDQQEEQQPAGEEDEKNSPSNLDLGAVLDGIRTRINKLEKGRWSVISTPEGVVLCQPDALWQVVKKLGGKTPEMLLGDADDSIKRKILGEIVDRMDKEMQAIDTSLIQPGYHTTQCLVVMGNGKAMRLPLIPFKAEAFKALPSQLEALKTPGLRKMVSTVKFNQKKGAGE